MYYFVSFHYKIYEWSRRGTALSILGAILNGFFCICICSIIALLIGIPTAENPNYMSDIKFVIPIIIVIGIAMLILGKLLQGKAEKLSNLDFEKKVKNDFQFAKKMAKQNPDQKEWYMERNAAYADYVSSGREAFESGQEDDETVKKFNIVRFLLTLIIASVFIFGGMYLLNSF